MSALASAVWLAAVSAALAVACASPPTSRRRLAALSEQWAPSTGPSRPGRAIRRRHPPPPVLAGLAAGIGVAAFVDGRWGVLLGVVVAVVAPLMIGRLEPAAVRRRRETLAATLPLAVDLLAACLSVGRPPAESLRVVSRAVGNPLAEELDVVAARLSLGADPVDVWRELVGVQGMAPLGRAMARTIETGAAVADALGRLADDLRRERRAATEQEARSVGVRAAAPLGLCFLPAFVLIGIVPAIAGAFASLDLW